MSKLYRNGVFVRGREEGRRREGGEELVRSLFEFCKGEEDKRC